MLYKLLIVDDSKLARTAVGNLLAALHPDWLRFEAASASEALLIFNDHAPQFVLLDFNMPGTDGIAVAAQLRQLSPATHVAIASANRQPELIERVVALGAGFLAKPLTKVILAEYLDAALVKLQSAIQ